MLIGVKIDEF